MEIKAKYPHTKVGQFLFDLCASWTIFVLKYKWLYYLTACTWGIIMTLIGSILTGILFIVKLFNKNIIFQKYNWIYYIKAGPKYWGGCEMGLMFLRDHKSRDSYINPHEFGHTFQNCIFGPLFPFIVAIPSAVRYWLREFFPNKKWADYDAIWFEDSATRCGEYVDRYINKKVEK